MGTFYQQPALGEAYGLSTFFATLRPWLLSLSVLPSGPLVPFHRQKFAGLNRQERSLVIQFAKRQIA
jgi:hypothetical protein